MKMNPDLKRQIPIFIEAAAGQTLLLVTVPIGPREGEATHKWMVYVRGDKDSPHLPQVDKVRRHGFLGCWVPCDPLCQWGSPTQGGGCL